MKLGLGPLLEDIVVLWEKLRFVVKTGDKKTEIEGYFLSKTKRIKHKRSMEASNLCEALFYLFPLFPLSFPNSTCRIKISTYDINKQTTTQIL